jgi:hypothetical protein
MLRREQCLPGDGESNRVWKERQRVPELQADDHMHAASDVLRERGMHLRTSRVPMRIERMGHARRAATGFAFIGAAACLAACASIWGFEDLRAGDGGAEVTKNDDATPLAEGGGATDDATEPVDTGAGEDASLAEDAKKDIDASRMRDAARDASSDAPDASEVTDAAAFMKCVTICTGCCDPAGTCISQPAVTTCGIGGVACVNCNKTQSCLFPACCGATTGICGCSAAGVLCNKN